MNQNRFSGLLYVLLFVLSLVLGLLVMSGCAGYDRTKDVGCTPGHPGDICERQPAADQRPAWFRISPPGT